MRAGRTRRPERSSRGRRRSTIPAGLLGLALCLIGCHETRVLPAPELTGARSMLIGYRIDGEVVRVEARDLEQGLPVLSRNEADGADLVVATYACPLDTYGLRAGPLVVLDVPRAEVSMPPALFTQTLDLDAPEGGWRPVAPTGPEPSDMLTRLVVELPVELCPGFEATPIDFDPDPSPDLTLSNIRVEVSVALDEGRALVVTATRGGGSPLRSFIVDRSGQVTPVTIGYRGPASSTLPPGHLAYDAQGRLWHVTSDGTVAQGTLESGLDVLGTAPLTAGEVGHVVVASGPSAGEPAMFLGVWSRTSPAVVEWQGRSEVLATAGLGFPLLAAPSADELVVAELGLFDGKVHDLRRSAGTWSDTIQEIAAPPSVEALNGFVAATVGVAVDRGGRVVLVQRFVLPPFYFTHRASSLLELRGSTWQRLERGFDTEFLVDTATPLGGGVLAMGGLREGVRRESALSLYQHGVGPCYQETLSGGEVPPHLVALDADTLLVIPAGTNQSAFLVRRTRAAPECLAGR